ncbi:MAG: AAA family ATPase [Candidatus Hydrogenedentes bacterium]|nr:AAA family ATPase [Candidatus Hydrogenedentota bacterium]
MSREFLQNVDELIRARYPLLYVVTWEEERVRQLLAEVARAQGKSLLEWSITDGLRAIVGERRAPGPNQKRERNVLALLNEILQADASCIYLLKDFHTYLEAPEIVRQMRDLCQALRSSHKTMVICSPFLKIPVELEKAVTIVDLPLPSYEELSRLLDERVLRGPGPRSYRIQLTPAERDGIIKAAQGLTLTEAENAFAKSIVRDKTLDGRDVQAIMFEKVQIIRKSGLLEYYDLTSGLTTLGGMDLLKDWVRKRVRAFSQEAREYGLPPPRGILLMGVQGCGKSLAAKSIATVWSLPLLRLDMSRIFQGYIGSSEDNMRRALKVAESLAPVVLWIDEIEKAFSGVEGSSATDAGTTARVIGQYLTWMQEKSSPVFVVATANNVQHLPPELLRKGRLDEIFFIDLPRTREAAEIFSIHLKRLRRDPAAFDLNLLAAAAKGFSGAEIEQAIISAMYDSFFAGREVTTQDILNSLQETVPLSRTMRESIDSLRAWAADRARPASSLADPKRNTDNGSL